MSKHEDLTEAGTALRQGGAGSRSMGAVERREGGGCLFFVYVCLVLPYFFIFVGLSTFVCICACLFVCLSASLSFTLCPRVWPQSAWIMFYLPFLHVFAISLSFPINTTPPFPHFLLSSARSHLRVSPSFLAIQMQQGFLLSSPFTSHLSLMNHKHKTNERCCHADLTFMVPFSRSLSTPT